MTKPFGKKMFPLNSISIVGVGLIGGSIGLAAQKHGLAREVVGIGRRQSSLDKALRVGAVHRATTDMAEGVRHADLVIVCSPVGLIVDHVRQCAGHCPEGALLTDAGSTKKTLVEQLDGQLPRGCRFLGGHPLAGSEKTGPEHAFAELYENRLAILTPTEHTRGDDLTLLREFWQGLGSKVVTMTPDEHDRVLALTSHMPHAASAALAATLDPDMAQFTGSGFRDTSRLGAGDPTLWTHIFTQNREYVVEAIGILQQRLDALREAIEQNDRSLIATILSDAKQRRDMLSDSVDDA